jgi:hypothetical protein
MTMPHHPRGNVVPFPAITLEYPNFHRRDLPADWAIQPTIARLREIAALSVDHLVTEGSVHQDHKLLLLCAEALSLIDKSDLYREERQSQFDGREWTDEKRKRSDVVLEQARELSTAAASLIKRARKLKATTPAAVYAKALVVRASLSGAAGLGQSLAEDLIACEGLRQTLIWPEARP